MTVLCFLRINGFSLKFWNLMRKRGYGIYPMYN